MLTVILRTMWIKPSSFALCYISLILAHYCDVSHFILVWFSFVWIVSSWICLVLHGLAYLG